VAIPTSPSGTLRQVGLQMHFFSWDMAACKCFFLFGHAALGEIEVGTCRPANAFFSWAYGQCRVRVSVRVRVGSGR
jgi:hypothetical protein